MTRTTCTTNKCRRWKNLDENGVCPIHTSVNPIEDQNQEVCTKCSIVVNDVDPAISCDSCDKWCHLDCTDVNEDLYKLIDPNEGDPPMGIKWFCECCLSDIIKLLKTLKNNKNAQTQTAVKCTQFDGVKVPICENYRHGTCVHGLSGKKIVAGNSCLFKHPKKCVKYCQFGNNPNLGCTNTECRFLHPILCRNSTRQNYCDKENCTYVHLKGTQRRPNHYKESGNNRNQFQYNNSSRRSYSRFNNRNLGFQTYSSKRRGITQQQKLGYNANDRNANQNFIYHESEFPTVGSCEYQPSSYPPNEQTNETNFYSNNSFLELLQAVKSMQQSQISIQNELQDLRRRVPPISHPQHQFPVSQSQQFPQTQLTQAQAMMPGIEPHH